MRCVTPSTTAEASGGPDTDATACEAAPPPEYTR